MLRVNYGKALQQARKDTGLTQAQLADLLDCSVQYVSEMERGHRRPSGMMAARIEDEVGLSAETIVDARYEAECTAYGVLPRWRR